MTVTLVCVRGAARPPCHTPCHTPRRCRSKRPTRGAAPPHGASSCFYGSRSPLSCPTPSGDLWTSFIDRFAASQAAPPPSHPWHRQRPYYLIQRYWCRLVFSIRLLGKSLVHCTYCRETDGGDGGPVPSPSLSTSQQPSLGELWRRICVLLQIYLFECDVQK